MGTMKRNVTRAIETIKETADEIDSTSKSTKNLIICHLLLVKPIFCSVA